MLGQMRQSIFQDTNLSLLQQSILDQFSEVGKIPFINGNLFKDVSLTTGTANVINHKLGKKATGYFIFSIEATSTIWNDVISGDSSITLRCSADTTVTLWIF